MEVEKDGDGWAVTALFEGAPAVEAESIEMGGMLLAAASTKLPCSR